MLDRGLSKDRGGGNSPLHAMPLATEERASAAMTYVPWSKLHGDFSLDRYRHVLENKNRFRTTSSLMSSHLLKSTSSAGMDKTFGGHDQYFDGFDWDRGGKVGPYHVRRSDIPPPRTSVNAYPPTLLELGAEEAGEDKKPLRLPTLHNVVPKTLQKSASCVAMFPHTTFHGRFSTQSTFVAPVSMNPKVGRAVSQKGFVAPAQLEGEKQVKATQRLWRESSTGDMYWAPAGKKDKDKKKWDPFNDEVPGMASSVREGASINWKNPDADGKSLFAMKCWMNERKMVEYLYLRYGPDLLTVDRKDRNLFHHCAEANAYETATFLLRKLEQPGSKSVLPFLLLSPDEDGNTPLHLAAASGSKVVAELYLKAHSFKELLFLRNARGEYPKDTATRHNAYHLRQLVDPNTYVQDPNSLANRMRMRLEKDSGNNEEDGDNEDAGAAGGDDDDEDEEGGGGGALKTKFKNLLSLDRQCNQTRAAELKAAKKKGGKKGGKKKKKK
ncbi:unnamed protein product [Amoebophrya sp. A120]|nr:unnamed protein product [Amoebophrya sp. A120]|eukprot:GSA120T00023069001.1